MIFLGSILVIGLLLMCICIFFLVRNEWVYNALIKEIDKDISKCMKLPSYDYKMYKKFWWFNIEKFYKEAE